MIHHLEQEQHAHTSIRKFDCDRSPWRGCSAVQLVIGRSSPKPHLIWKPRARKVRNPHQDLSVPAFSSAGQAKCQ